MWATATQMEIIRELPLQRGIGGKMAIHFTDAQQKVLQARNHNILVSAAAGSGKTAVLVERIVRLISEGDRPVDIDRLLVVTFTRAAAAQMRERIGQAITARLREDPGNAHLQKQEVLLHNAQITTMDSFFTFLLRNYFSDIDLDPGFRQIDPTEAKLLEARVLEDFLEERYAEKDPAFLRCAAYFCPGSNDRGLETLILDLCKQAGSHPSPEAWLHERAEDYHVADQSALFRTPWMRSAVLRTADLLLEADSAYEAMKEVCRRPGGPDICEPFFAAEQEGLLGRIRPLRSAAFSGGEDGQEELLAGLWEEVRRALAYSFARYPSTRGKKYDYMDEDLKTAAKSMRDAEKDRIVRLRKKIGDQSPALILATMEAAREPMETLAGLAIAFMERLQEVKRERHLIDFVDLEHFALNILAERREDGTWQPRRAARALRSHYAEILIDEYQDSNEVQELLLQIISGEDDGRNNRFMVGDIKQSIYRFRLARPEIFMEKYDAYLPDDPQTERIELDQNFRSRGEVLDCVNALFLRIMRREVGGVGYNTRVSLKKGADFPDGTEKEMEAADQDYRAEFLLLDTAVEEGDTERTGEDPGAEDPEARDPETGGEESGEDGIAVLSGEVRSLSDRQKEALLIAKRIRQLVGRLPVKDEETGDMRPARYGDIVILLRSTVGWNEDLRAVFENEGIPAYAESRTGYFAAREIRTLIELLHVLDNPRQDIPLYGAMHGYFGDFSQDEIARVRLVCRDGQLWDALCIAAGKTDDDAGPGKADRPGSGYIETGTDEPLCPENACGGEKESFVPDTLREKCRRFIGFLEKWRLRARWSTVSELVPALLEETGYEDYCAALPAGSQRAANLRLMENQADAFTKTDMTGLFQFLQYIDGLHKQEIDYGEPNILDESADVVRIMSIHKSKGLEFPVCFVAGLSKPFSFRRFDASGPMLFDGDWGCGIHYFDPASRVRATTLRREEIAEKIRRDCMGEELRVLYVAMTRAKEKLILTASAPGMAAKLQAWQSGMAGFFHQKGSQSLSGSMIGSASCFAQLIYQAVAAVEGPDFDPAQDCREFPVRICMYTGEDLVLHSASQQLDLQEIDSWLRTMEGRPLDSQPDPRAARRLADTVFRVYPHEDLRDLYAQTSVSEIKHRAMHDSLRAALQTEEGGGESAADLFPEITPAPYVPAFVRRESIQEDEGKEGASEGGPGQVNLGALRGTAFHRAMELMEYDRMEDFTAGGGEGQVQAWIRTQVQKGRMDPGDAALVSIPRVLQFLRSPLAARMAAADRRQALYREQPFVLGMPASRLDRTLPDSEMVTVQGIIDAFFIEEDAIILADYKTDRVRTGEELAGRYRIQLEIYAEALEKSFALPVREKILYSTALGREILL